MKYSDHWVEDFYHNIEKTQLKKIEKEYHVYKTINIDTGEYYIGYSGKKNRNIEVYSGSFFYIGWINQKSQLNLKKEILACGFKTKQEAFEIERVLINEVINDEKCININNPCDGFYYDATGKPVVYNKKNPNKYFRVSSEEFKNNDDLISIHKGKSVSTKVREKIRSSLKEWHRNNKNSMYGKNHSEKTKKLMSNKRKKWHKNNKHPRSKLSHTDILEIRAIPKWFKISQQEIADSYGVHQTQISSLLNYKTYKNI